MRIEFVEHADGRLPTVISRVADAPSVRGLAVLVADGSLSDPTVLDPTLQALSVPAFGGVFPQVLHGGANHDDGAVVAGLSVEPTVTTVAGLADPSSSFRAELPDPPGGGTAFVFADAYAARVDAFVATLFRNWGVEVGYLGGGAGSLDGGQQPCVVTNDGVVENAATVATVDRASSVGVRHGWQEVAGPFEITAASDRTIVDLEREPAFDVYSRVVEDDTGAPVAPEDFFDVAKSYPFGLSRLCGEKIVRDPYEVTDDDGLRCFGAVPEGQFVHVLRGNPEALVEAAGAAYDEAVSGAVDDGTVLFFDCISRVLYLEDGFDAELDAVGGHDDPAFGALTIGEIANDGEGHLDYYNKTAVTAVIEDG